MSSAVYWIDKLGLEPHPEGGYFREVYRSEDTVSKAGLPDRFDGDRSAATLIYYLLRNDEFSTLHRIKSDEIWVHIAGGNLDIHQIRSDGEYKKHQLGKNLDSNQTPVCVIEQGTWFGASLPDENTFCLCTCLVAPGFDFTDFEMGDPEQLKKAYPEHITIINKLRR